MKFHTVDRSRMRAVPAWHPMYVVERLLTRELQCKISGLGLSAGQQLLDYGCADQQYRSLLNEEVLYVGADLPGNARAQVHVNEQGLLPSSISQMDAVLSTQVLEHVADPQLYLQECWRVLKPGGRLLLSTHGIMVYHPDPVDYWRWTGAGLEKALQQQGFEITNLSGVMGLAASGLLMVQMAVRSKLPALLRPPITLLMQGLIRLADRIHSDASRRANALVFVVEARKPLA